MADHTHNLKHDLKGPRNVTLPSVKPVRKPFGCAMRHAWTVFPRCRLQHGLHGHHWAALLRHFTSHQRIRHRFVPLAAAKQKKRRQRWNPKSLCRIPRLLSRQFRGVCGARNPSERRQTVAVCMRATQLSLKLRTY